LQKGSIPRLLDLGQDAKKIDEDVALKKQSDNHKPGAKNISPRDELLDHVKKLVIDSGGKISERAERHLKCLFARCIDAAANEILYLAFEKYAEKQDSIITKQSALLPNQNLSMGDSVVVTPSHFPEATTTTTTTTTVVNVDENEGEVVEPVDEFEDYSTATNKFLSELKEEVLLQSLLT
jgi:hypothetical protein